MIRKLTVQDHKTVMDFLSEEPSINLFIIGDIEAFGYETDFQELWGEFHEDGKLNAVLLRYFESFIPYAKGEFDVQGFADLICNYSATPIMSGKASIVEQFEHVKGIELGPKKATFFAECRELTPINHTEYNIKIATIDDVDRILNLRMKIDEFSLSKEGRKMIVQDIENGTGRTYFIEDNKQIIACASTAAENSASAMIVGVCTHKNFRNNGLATAIMQKLIGDVLAEGRILCLFYDNPAAGRIYKRLGFQDIGKWTMYRKYKTTIKNK